MSGAAAGIYAANVRCDASTHTQADIAAGSLNVVIGFAPLRPAEFIVRRITMQL